MTYPPIYSDRQQRVLGYLPLATAPFSVIGSFLIIYSIYADRKKTLKSVYHRLMLGMSTMDFISSLSMVVFDPWAVPKEASYYFVDAKGTFGTCEASGFFLNLFFCGMWYATFLAIYFLCVVYFEIKDKVLAKWLEPVAHFISIVVPLISGLGVLVTNGLNPTDLLPGWCFTLAYPAGCYKAGEQPEDEYQEECQRGGRISRRKSGYTALINFCVILVCMVLMVWKVRSIEIRIRRYAGGASNQLRRTQEISKQSLFYIAAFFFTFFPIFMIQVMTPYRYHQYFFAFAVVVKFVSPLQGFFNAVVYLRPRFRTLVDDGGSLAFLRRIPVVTTTLPSKSSVQPPRSRPTSRAGQATTVTHADVSEVSVQHHGDCSEPGLQHHGDCSEPGLQHHVDCSEPSAQQHTDVADQSPVNEEAPIPPPECAVEDNLRDENL